MLTFPRAKINIGLNVLERRPDGYHNIETLFYPIGLCDILEAVPDPDGGRGTAHLSLSGLPVEGEPEGNLVIRAYERLHRKFGLPAVRIFLHKRIPTGAGLGGGSSDGTSMLLLLDELFHLGLSQEELSAFALELGSDCPFFLKMKPSLAKGRGEQMTEHALSLEGYWLALFHPGTGISTGEAYRAMVPGYPAISLARAVEAPVREWRNLIINDFESYAFARQPVISRIREELYRAGALYGSMTGSGSAVYGLFEKPPEINAFLEATRIWQERLA